VVPPADASPESALLRTIPDTPFSTEIPNPKTAIDGATPLPQPTHVKGTSAWKSDGVPRDDRPGAPSIHRDSSSDEVFDGIPEDVR